MLQGSGAMPTLVVEEGLVPFASGETPTGPWPPWPTYPAGVAMGGIYDSTEDSACPPSPQLPSPGGAVKPSGVASGTLPGALPPPPMGHIPRCASQCMALTPVREVPWPQLPGKPRLAWGRWVTRASPSRGPCRLRLDGFSQPVVGTHLPAVGGGDPAVQHPGAGEDLQPAAGAPAHAPRALWGLPGPRELLPAQVAGPGRGWGPAQGRPQFLPGLTIGVSLPELPKPPSPEGSSKDPSWGGDHRGCPRTNPDSETS